MIGAEYRIDGAVLDIAIRESTVYVADNKGRLFALKKDNLRPYGPPVVMANNKLHRYSRSISFSPDQTVLFYAVNENKIQRYDLMDKSFATAEVKHKGEVEAVAFAQHGIAAIGDSGGIVHTLEGSSFKSNAKTPPRSDSISTISFDSDNRFVAVGGFDGKAVVYVVDTLQKAGSFLINEPVEAIAFVSDYRIIILGRSGKLFQRSFLEKTVFPKEEELGFWPTKIEIFSESNLIVAASREGELYLIEASSGLPLVKIKLPYGGISAIRNVEGDLYIGLVNGYVCRIGTEEDKQEITRLIDLGQFKKIYAVLEKKPWCLLYQNHEAVQKGWEKDRLLAMKNLERGNFKIAELLLRPYQYSPEKNIEILRLLERGESFAKLASMVEENRYADALKWCEQHSYLLQSECYQQLLGKWQKVVSYVGYLIEENQNGHKEKIEKILRPYLQVKSQAPLVHALLYQPGVFKEAKQLVAQKKLDDYMNLVSRHPFLKETELFAKIALNADLIMNKAMECEAERRYHDAIRHLEFLSSIPHLKEKAQSLRYELLLRDEMQQALEAKQYSGVSERLQTHPKLIYSPEYEEFVETFRSIVKECRKLAEDADISKMRVMLSGFFRIKGFEKTIQELYGIAYIHEMRFDYQKNRDVPKLKRGVENYLRWFGQDKRLTKLLASLGVENDSTILMDETIEISQLPLSVYESANRHL